jgi:flagellar L-ring protein precursor FlgH
MIKIRNKSKIHNPKTCPEETGGSKQGVYYKIFFIVGILILGFGILALGFGNWSFVSADSLWKEDESISPYSTERAYKVGDIVGLIIVESTSAVQKAGTNTDVDDELTLKFNYALNRTTNSPQSYSEAFGKAKNKYKGLGDTQRYANVSAKLSARVVEVLPGGILKIVGTHRIEVNDEEQQIIVTGIVRAKDISMANTVYSYQVAQPEIIIKGVGAVQEAESPGWITRIFNWVF